MLLETRNRGNTNQTINYIRTRADGYECRGAIRGRRPDAIQAGGSRCGYKSRDTNSKKTDNNCFQLCQIITPCWIIWYCKKNTTNNTYMSSLSCHTINSLLLPSFPFFSLPLWDQFRLHTMTPTKPTDVSINQTGNNSYRQFCKQILADYFLHTRFELCAHIKF